MQVTRRFYPGQFTPCEDLLQLAIPHLEVIAEMALRGEAEALNDACLAIGVAADAVQTARAGGDGPRR